MNENFDKLIRDYAEGSLTGDALRNFEEQIKKEPGLQAEIDLYLALKAADNLRLKKQLLQTAKHEGLTPQAPPPALLRRLPLVLAAAATLALLLTAIWWWRQPAAPDAGQLAQTYLAKPYPPPVATMGEADTRPAALQSAFLAYRNGDFAAAAQQLGELAAQPDASDETLFYAGEAMLQTGQWERAIAQFDRVQPGYWRETADWRTALALIKNSQPASARPLLEKLRNSSRQTQVEALLKVLE